MTGASSTKGKTIVNFINNKSQKKERIECDKVLVAVGRKPNIGNDIMQLNIQLDKTKKLKLVINLLLQLKIFML